MQFDPSTDPRVQEALSRKYSNDVVILLPLRGEQVAVFNSGRELCGFVGPLWEGSCQNDLWLAIQNTWHPPTAIEPKPTPKATLADLELL